MVFHQYFDADGSAERDRRFVFVNHHDDAFSEDLMLHFVPDDELSP